MRSRRRPACRAPILVNDFEAVAQAVPALGAPDLVQIGGDGADGAGAEGRDRGGNGARRRERRRRTATAVGSLRPARAGMSTLRRRTIARSRSSIS